MSTRNPYPSDVSDDEWAFVAPYLTLLPTDAGQRYYDLREVYNGLRWMVRTGASLSHDAARPAALVHCLSTDPALAGGGLFRGDGGGPAPVVARRQRPQRTAQRGHFR